MIPNRLEFEILPANQQGATVCCPVTVNIPIPVTTADLTTKPELNAPFNKGKLAAFHQFLVHICSPVWLLILKEALLQRVSHLFTSCLRLAGSTSAHSAEI